MTELNGHGTLGEDGRPWRATVHQVLTNPKYIGANIYNRRSFKLKHRHVNNPTQMWIWRDGAFEPIVSASVFEQARAIIESRHHHLSDQDLLEKLRELLRARGRLSGILIGETEAMFSSSCYSSRFGSLTLAYSLPGANMPKINQSMVYLGACLIAGIRLARERQVNFRIVPTGKAIEKSVDLANEIYNRKVPQKISGG